VRPLEPWNPRWFYGDVLFVIDPYVDLLLLLGIVLGSYYAGARRLITATSLGLVIAYMGCCVYLRNAARDQLATLTASVSNFERSAVSPQPFNPLRWTGIVETKEAISMIDLDVPTGRHEELERFVKPGPSPILDAAERTRAGAVFAGFARFPVAKVESVPGGYRVQLIDVRYYRSQNRSAFAAEVLLNSSMQVIREDMGFNHAVTD
jgi:inner membrane protein